MSTNYVMSLFVVRENGEVDLHIKNKWNNSLKSFQEFLEWSAEESYESFVDKEVEKKFKELSKFKESTYLNAYLKKDVEHLPLKSLATNPYEFKMTIDDPSLLDGIEPIDDLRELLDQSVRVYIYKEIERVFRGRYYSADTLNRAFKDIKNKLESVQRDIDSIMKLKNSIDYWKLSSEERCNMDEEISSLTSMYDNYFNHLLVVNSLESMCDIFSDEGFDGQPYIHISSDWDVEDYEG